MNEPGSERENIHSYDGRIHHKDHIHDESCKLVMAIRNTTVDDGVELLEKFLVTRPPEASSSNDGAGGQEGTAANPNPNQSDRELARSEFVRLAEAVKRYLMKIGPIEEMQAAIHAANIVTEIQPVLANQRQSIQREGLRRLIDELETLEGIVTLETPLSHWVVNLHERVKRLRLRAELDQLTSNSSGDGKQ